MAGKRWRDEPPFINLDRLLNPGFDETPGRERTYTYVTARRLRVHARTQAGVGIALAHREPGADNIIIKRQYRADIDSTEESAPLRRQLLSKLKK